ncbi:flavodoxin family protein [Sphingobacterium puteale]|uniref:Flavodoxin family protein n=1 Tax=Sphingobacterium puteale TaxID=2420510 RepID=A0A420VXP8_9SPHI|nr:NAD(P)H-dependent oxidoreductase [Sphingobacterium puteale]RKO71173.1 flavodoxin family protein [Sphingobacterium puteale]
MKHLIIYAHPIDSSLNNHFKQIVKETLLQNGQEVIVRDLYQLNFNPVLSLDDVNGQRRGIVDQDVKREQDYIIWADSITFIYPIWWTGMPAIMKGYIDRVFSYGFAYRYDAGVQKGLLTGKSAYIINSQGKSMMEYQETGMDKALKLTSDKGIYSYCGLEIKQHFFFDRADRAEDHTVEAWGSQLRQVYLENKLAV